MKTLVIVGRVRTASHFSLAAAIAAAGIPTTASAEDDMTETAENADPVTAGAQVYEPAYFDQFAPRNALDMIRRIPGFTINSGDNNSRGFGEADQNVIVNGERFSSKSDSIRDLLQRISASDIVRIEVLDGTSLDIPGLSGQVANVVYTSNGTSGQFSWRTGFRPHNTEAQLYGGEVSVTGSSGALDYTVALSNDNDRFGADGPVLITDANGALIEEQFSKMSGKFDNPKLSGNFGYDFGGETVANLNISYGQDYFQRREPEIATTPGGLVRERDFRIKETGPEYEIGADIEFPLGPGKLKLIGLERFERDDFRSRLVDSFNNGDPDVGSRFRQVNDIGERIGRFEYGWNMFKADWQISGEAAFNRLDRESELFDLDASGQFVELDFPSGTGGVTEDRYEAILSITKQLTPKLSMQFTGGGEYSKIEQTGSAANSRSFQRPKGSLSFTWKPKSDFDVTVEIARRVSQLSFGDFLASVNLNNENANGGNNELVPYQSWNVEAEINKNFGAWGSAKLQLRQAWFEDFIDFFPLPGDGEARGNIGDAKRTHMELSGTLLLDPIGWKGAQIEFTGIKRWMSIEDPFTGLDRGFSYDLNDRLELDFRHDIPSTDYAYGVSLFTFNPEAYSRRRETGRDWEGPSFVHLFIEHKNVFGMTAKAEWRNILGARNRFVRTVFDGDRPVAPVLFNEDMDRRIGPIFRFTLSGNF